jgi:chorismate-pyruvate lyase
MASQSIDWLAGLRSLADGLIEIGSSDVTLIERADVPPPFKALLVHHEHMTSTLEEYYSAAVDLVVLRDQQDEDLYRRMILLRRSDTNGIVEFGIVRIQLDCVGADVREEILAGRRPLGEILLQKNVLRKIEPKWFVRFERSSCIGAFFPGVSSDLYGRLAIIHYDGRAAIELLEVVCG